jgi:hypothetical protein
VPDSSPSWAIGTFVPTSISYKLSTNNKTSINKKKSYTSPNSSTKATNNKISPSKTKIRLTHQKSPHTIVDAIPERYMNKYVSLPP